MVKGCCGKQLENYDARDVHNPLDEGNYRAMLITKGEIDPLYIPGAKCGDGHGLKSQVFICDTCARKLGFVW